MSCTALDGLYVERNSKTSICKIFNEDKLRWYIEQNNHGMDIHVLMECMSFEDSLNKTLLHFFLQIDIIYCINTTSNIFFGTCNAIISKTRNREKSSKNLSYLNHKHLYHQISAWIKNQLQVATVFYVLLRFTAE